MRGSGLGRVVGETTIKLGVSFYDGGKKYTKFVHVFIYFHTWVIVCMFVCIGVCVCVCALFVCVCVCVCG